MTLAIIDNGGAVFVCSYFVNQPFHKLLIYTSKINSLTCNETAFFTYEKIDYIDDVRKCTKLFYCLTLKQ